jgi:hypothetical protein
MRYFKTANAIAATGSAYAHTERGAGGTHRHCLVNEANACGLLEKETVESEHERFREETA